MNNKKTELVLTDAQKDKMLIDCTQRIEKAQRKGDASALEIARELYTIYVNKLAGKGKEFTEFVTRQFGIQETSCRDAIAVWKTFSDETHKKLIPEAQDMNFSQLKAMVPLAKKSTPIETIERCGNKTYAEIAEIRKSEMTPKTTKKVELTEEQTQEMLMKLADLIGEYTYAITDAIEQCEKEVIIKVPENFYKILPKKRIAVVFQVESEEWEELDNGAE